MGTNPPGKKHQTMKTGIHPEYVETSVRCACGNTFTTRSTKPNMRVDLCSKCHPFFTGDQRLVDTGGQVERFMRRLNRSRSGSAAAEEPAEAPSAS
jgi:large subunit ribosomal protein L31